MQTPLTKYQHQAKYTLRYTSNFTKNLHFKLVIGFFETSRLCQQCIMDHCNHLQTRCEGRILLITLEQDVTEMRNLSHCACHDESFSTSYRTISALKYFESSLVKSEMYEYSAPASAAHKIEQAHAHRRK